MNALPLQTECYLASDWFGLYRGREVCVCVCGGWGRGEGFQYEINVLY